MIIKSLKDEKEWIWVNIPKTASTLLFKTFYPHLRYNDQKHRTYTDSIEEYGMREQSFTIVRHPVTRFMSALNHIFSICECKKCTFDITHPPTTEEVILFLEGFVDQYHKHNNYFSELYKNRVNILYFELAKVIQKTFIRNIKIHDPDGCLRWSAFMPQTHALDNAKNLQIFRYEKMDRCFTFIQNELGYQVNSTVKYRNYTSKLSLVDINNSKIRALLYELYSDDFKTYGYDYACTFENR